jgi:hypothetical protein
VVLKLRSTAPAIVPTASSGAVGLRAARQTTTAAKMRMRTHLNATVAHLFTSFTGPEAIATRRSTGEAPRRPAATPEGGVAFAHPRGGLR